MIRYTCVNCGQMVDLPNEKMDKVHSCASCTFTNWVSGVNAVRLDASPHVQPQPAARPAYAPPRPVQTPAAKPQPQAAPRPQPHQAQPRPATPSETARTTPSVDPLRTLPQTTQRPAAAPSAGATKPQAGSRLSQEPLPGWLKPGTTTPKAPPPLPPEAKSIPTKPGPLDRNSTISDLEDQLMDYQRQAGTHQPTSPRRYTKPSQRGAGESGTVPEATGALLLAMFAPFSAACNPFLALALAAVAIGLGFKAKWKISAEPGREGGGVATFAILLGFVDIIIALAVSGRGCR